MSSDNAQRFIDALHALEDDRDVEPLVEMTAGDADTANVVTSEAFHGPDGAREFWGAYRAHFDTMHSDFRTTISDGDDVALEWTTTGETSHGDKVTYDGTSLIRFDGDRVARFRAYFDPKHLGRQLQPG